MQAASLSQPPSTPPTPRELAHWLEVSQEKYLVHLRVMMQPAMLCAFTISVDLYQLD